VIKKIKYFIGFNLGATTFSFTTFSLMTFSITTLGITITKNATLSITTFSIMTLETVMLSVVNKPFERRVIMLKVVAPLDWLHFVFLLL
jgi:hypothetical protein